MDPKDQSPGIADPLPNYRVATAETLIGFLEGEAGTRERAERRQRDRAKAHGEMCAALGVRASEMMPSHREFAEALDRRRQGVTTTSRGYGFRLDTTGRRPHGRP